MMLDSLLLISCMACCNLPVSEQFVTRISLVKSPAAIRSACSTACWMGTVMLFVMPMHERGHNQSNHQEQQCNLRPTA